MTDITTYPMIDDFDTTLAQSWDGAVGTVYLNEAVGITLPASTTTYIVVNPWKSTMQVAKINAVNNTLKTATVNSITVDKGAWVAYTQQSHPVGSIVRISTNYAFWKDIIDSVNTKVNTNDDDIAQGKFADATARDAYFTSPVNGNSAYLTAEGKRTDYVAWAWADRASGTNPNASDTVAGKVEISSQVEFDAWTATGGTGANVVATNDQIRKQISTATAKTTPVNADSLAISDSAASGVIKRTTITEFKAAANLQATTTTSWFVELATDAEALAGTDQTRYINSLQLKNWSWYTVYAEQWTALGDLVSLLQSANTARVNTSLTYIKVKEIVATVAWTYTVYFEIKADNSTTAFGRIYVDWVAVWTERSTTSTSYVWYLENITVTAGQLIQLYYKKTGTNSHYAEDFRLYWFIKPVSLTLTVNTD